MVTDDKSTEKPYNLSIATIEKVEKIGKDTIKQLPWKDMTVKEKYKYILTNITVEPILACYIMPSVLASLATQNLNLEKACRVNLGYDDHVCDALSARQTANYTYEESQVQQLVAGMSVWKTILQSALPSLLIMFLGSWSDRWGCRKPCMLLPIVGEFLTSIGLILCTYFYFLPMEVAGVTEALFPALTGGWFTMFMATFSYIGDVTSEADRTLRIGVVNVFCSMGVPLGSALSGILYVKIGFYGVFSISAVLYLFAFLYGFLCIKEEKKPITVKKKDQTCAFLRDFFDVKNIAETFKVAFKKGENKRKTKVILLMVVVCVVIGPMHGEMAVMYLFTRYRFNWGEVDYSIFSTYAMVTNLIGTMISVGLFSHLLRIDDAMIGVFSCASKILSGFVYAYAESTWAIYMAPIVEILNGTSFIAMRSMASKLVPAEELGKVNSLFGVCEALMPLVYGPMYSAMYAKTMHTLPGGFFLLGGALTAPALLIFLWFYNESKKEQRLAKLEKEEKEKRRDSDMKKGKDSITFIKDDRNIMPNEVGYDNPTFKNEVNDNSKKCDIKKNGDTNGFVKNIA